MKQYVIHNIKKYTITADLKKFKPIVVYTEQEAIEVHATATALYNKKNNLTGDNAYIDYNHRFEADKNMTFEKWVEGNDCIFCDIKEIKELIK